MRNALRRKQERLVILSACSCIRWFYVPIPPQNPRSLWGRIAELAMLLSIDNVWCIFMHLGLVSPRSLLCDFLFATTTSQIALFSLAFLCLCSTWRNRTPCSACTSCAQKWCWCSYLSYTWSSWICKCPLQKCPLSFTLVTLLTVLMITFRPGNNKTSN